MTSDHPVKRRKKLIEVAIPLEAINAASAKEKNMRHGHPSGIHLWWSRKPLATARAILFLQLVDDPSSIPETFGSPEEQDKERSALFQLTKEIIQWDGLNNNLLLAKARAKIIESWHRCCEDNSQHPRASELFDKSRPPEFLDPFAGGGSIPLEAQRLGLEVLATDINPVSVLINRGLIDLPQRFQGVFPVNSQGNSAQKSFAISEASDNALAQDLQFYGDLLKEKAHDELKEYYQPIEITEAILGDQVNRRKDLEPFAGHFVTPIAYIWVRTVRSPNPSCNGSYVPLSPSFILSKKANQQAYIEPLIGDNSYKFIVRNGLPEALKEFDMGTRIAKGSFKCLLTGEPFPYSYIDKEACEGRLRSELVAVVAESPSRGRIYLQPPEGLEEKVKNVSQSWKPEAESRGTWGSNAQGRRYGFWTYGDYFSSRQLHMLNVLCRQVESIFERVYKDALASGLSPDRTPLAEKGRGAWAYAECICTYLSFLIGQVANHSSTVCGWHTTNAQIRNTFAVQGISMTWQYAESNPFCSSSGSIDNLLSRQVQAISSLFAVDAGGTALQRDAKELRLDCRYIVSTDPPYYDNIGYSDLSDFFYVWLRKTARAYHSDLFSTISTPKEGEIYAGRHKYASKNDAEEAFTRDIAKALLQIKSASHPSYPITIYYAFKQSESVGDQGQVSTGWQAFLQGLVDSGLSISGTWPIATEMKSRASGFGKNSLSSSIAMVCSPKSALAPNISKSEFRRELRSCIPAYMRFLEEASICPADIHQAIIGPCMSIYSKYTAVLNSDDSVVGVSEALIEINSALDEYFSHDEGYLDPDTRFAITFFESFGYEERPYGEAEGLAVARNISVEGVVRAGILSASGGRAQLLRREQLDGEWDPSRDGRLCVWEATQHLIKKLNFGGEESAATLLGQFRHIPGHGELIANCRALAYRLYNHCEKTKQAEEARVYNGLVIAWPELERLACSKSTETTIQASLI